MSDDLARRCDLPVPATTIFKQSGAGGLAWRAFSYGYKNFVRPYLPPTTRFNYAGLPVARRRKLGDGLITPYLYQPPLLDISDYEWGLIAALCAHVRPGDRVIVVGGGVGVTSVVAAKQAGPRGRVTCFEGDREGVKRVRETARLNGIGRELDVRCAIVGPKIAVYGTSPSDITIAPNELSPCDVLELDCEGSEIAILENLAIRPRAIAVESHGVFGAPSAKVTRLLQGLGYSVQNLGIAEPSLAEKCRVEDVMILVGQRSVHG